LCGTAASYCWCGGALWGDKMPQSGGVLVKDVSAAFSMLFLLERTLPTQASSR
jgi:hypothetical protein